jgi:hypothetical protein
MSLTGTYEIEASRLRVDMSEKIAELEPDKSPLITLTKKMKRTRTVYNPEFDWLEQELGARWDAINNGAGYSSGDTSLVVDNGAYFRIGDLVKVPRTGETMLVTAINTNTLTVTRSWGTVAAAALVDDEPLVIIGNVNEEGATLRTILQKEPVKKTNYTQIVRTPVGVTATLQATKTYGPKPLSWYRHLGGIEHAVDLERTTLFGEKAKDQANGQNRRTTGGVLEFCTENILDVSSSTLTEQSFVEWLEDVFRYGSKEKILLACARLCTHIDLWSMGKLQTKPRDKTYGVAIKEYVSTHGVLYVTKHHLLEGATYGGYGIILDMDNIAYCPLEGRDTQLLTNRQANDEDAQKDEYLTEFGVEIRLPKTHAIIKGVA